MNTRYGSAKDTDQVEAVLEQLTVMIGLKEVKSQVPDIIDLIAAVQRRRQAGLPSDPLPSHLIFAGAPGTGKTTVARLYGQLLAVLGVLARSEVVEASRAKLVGRYIGHTAVQTTQVFERARGGVLFIDEAHNLARSAGAKNDFGQEAIDTLVQLMEDHRDEVVVIAAGYTDEIHEFLRANPGLASRFSRTIDFPPYSREELMTILAQQAGTAGFDLPVETLDVVREYLIGNAETFTQGNAREVRKLFEAMKTSQARRLAQLEHAGTQVTRYDLRTLLPEDMPHTEGT